MVGRIKKRRVVKAKGTRKLRRDALGVARSLVGVMESGGNNRGKKVMQIIRANGGTGPEPWCFAAGTLVSTPEGLKTIESLSAGDEVFSAQGGVVPVLDILSRKSKTVSVRAMGLDGTITTKNHPYLARRNSGRPGKPVFGDAEWVHAGDLKRGDMLCAPHLSGGWKEVDDLEAYVVGRWIADGWRTDGTQRGGKDMRREVKICCSHDESEELSSRLDAAGLKHSASHRSDTATEFRLPTSFLSMVDSCGKYAHGKMMPADVLSWNDAARHALLQGYIDGDGHVYEDGLISVNTVSRTLAHGVAQVARSLGLVPKLYAQERAATTVIQGRTVNQNGARYQVSFYPDGQRGMNHARVEDDMQWLPVRSVEKAEKQVVYNLTVAGSNTFIADGMAVHNCGDFVAYCYRRAGSRAVQRAWAAVRYLGYLGGMRVTKNARAGMIVCYTFDHTGIFDHYCNAHGTPVSRKRATHIVAIEGNTGASGAVSDGNGSDGVYKKVRSLELVSRFVKVMR